MCSNEIAHKGKIARSVCIGIYHQLRSIYINICSQLSFSCIFSSFHIYIPHRLSYIHQNIYDIFILFSNLFLSLHRIIDLFNSYSYKLHHHKIHIFSTFFLLLFCKICARRVFIYSFPTEMFHCMKYLAAIHIKLYVSNSNAVGYFKYHNDYWEQQRKKNEEKKLRTHTINAVEYVQLYITISAYSTIWKHESHFTSTFFPSSWERWEEEEIEEGNAFFHPASFSNVIQIAILQSWNRPLLPCYPAIVSISKRKSAFFHPWKENVVWKKWRKQYSQQQQQQQPS